MTVRFENNERTLLYNGSHLLMSLEIEWWDKYIAVKIQSKFEIQIYFLKNVND